MIIDVETLCLIAMLAADDYRNDLDDVCYHIHEAGYASGLEPPNYPVPVTGYDASIASNHGWITGGPKVILTRSYINGFIEGLEEILANS